MARPRALSDDQVLDFIGAALGDGGAGWTLTGAGAAAGVHPATLIKRFGSRHGVLVALSRRWIASLPTGPTTSDARAELAGWVASLSTSQDSPAQVLARVDMLVEDLRHPELAALLEQGWAKTATYLAALVRACQGAGRPGAGVAPEVVAHLLLDAAHGALLRAAVAREPARADPAGSLTALLEALT